MFARTEPLRHELARALPERPFALCFWDGTELPPTLPGGPVFTVRSPAAVAHLLRAPGQLGLGRAYAAGELEADDLDLVIGLLDGFRAPPIDRGTRVRLSVAALRACGLTRPPRVPASELHPQGRRHSRARDARAVRHHYDVSNDFFKLFLDASMTYSCAVFSKGATTLEDAQLAKRELVCTKLALEEGERLLDVGCGWGSFVLHAAARHGVSAVGITLSRNQAELARRRVAKAGLEGRVEIRLCDYRDLPQGERFDAIASIGMVEHVGANQIDVYAAKLAGLLEPGGRLLNHGIARLRHGDPEAGPFSERYVFPDAAPLHVSRVLGALERAGIEPEHVEGLRQDYIDTLSEWIVRLDANREQAERLAGGERVRVWRLYLRAARNGFATGFTSIFQVLGRRA
ncbi:MAG TPA: cyclopropane-fatty-acyl-phospholipid synthase family protein [Solirubrobacteraceae bacterium]|jgi:cyclopropane-fatty-acyl-phospholipid synthase|nr:cyclopropane-fatty-acyl-phospholipid synthase family protein [Solirubrobacteraceae bacterium]